jgi:hypothetical protein
VKRADWDEIERTVAAEPNEAAALPVMQEMAYAYRHEAHILDTVERTRAALQALVQNPKLSPAFWRRVLEDRSSNTRNFITAIGPLKFGGGFASSEGVAILLKNVVPPYICDIRDEAILSEHFSDESFPHLAERDAIALMKRPEAAAWWMTRMKMGQFSLLQMVRDRLVESFRQKQSTDYSWRRARTFLLGMGEPWGTPRLPVNKPSADPREWESFLRSKTVPPLIVKRKIYKEVAGGGSYELTNILQLVSPEQDMEWAAAIHRGAQALLRAGFDLWEELRMVEVFFGPIEDAGG